MSKRQQELFPNIPSSKTYVSDYPELAAEWHPTKNKGRLPEDVLHKSNKFAWWLCKQGHEWKANIDSRTRGNGCPYCSHKKPTTDYNLAVLHPELMDEWHPDRNHEAPSEYLPQSNVVVWWRCLKDHEWKAPIYRRSGGSGCPNCTNQTSKN